MGARAWPTATSPTASSSGTAPYAKETDMNAALITLDKPEHGYTVFELNQVLKPEQLNSLAAYLDDQQRLTRVALIGVGIACGLWPSFDAELVRLTHGVGTTTDGDLVLVPEEVAYDRYRPYDGATARYAPLDRKSTRLNSSHQLIS